MSLRDERNGLQNCPGVLGFRLHTPDNYIEGATHTGCVSWLRCPFIQSFGRGRADSMSEQDNGGDDPPDSGGANTAAQTPAVTAATFTSFDGKVAYDLMFQEFDAFPVERTSRINTDIGIVVQNGMYAVERLEPLIPELQKVVSDFDMTKIRRLRTCLLALNYLQTKYRALQRTTDTELVSWLMERKGFFKDLVAPLARAKVIKEGSLEFLKQGNNHHALAYAVVTLADMLFDNYEFAQTKLVTKAELVEARGKANELFLQLGTRQFGPDATQAVKVLRRKGFALTCEKWDDLEAFIRYARRNHGDADELMPTLFPKRPRKSSAAAEQTPGATDDTDADEDFERDTPAPAAAPTATADALTDLAAMNQRAAQAGAAKPGFPGGAPFRLTDDEEDKK